MTTLAQPLPPCPLQHSGREKLVRGSQRGHLLRRGHVTMRTSLGATGEQPASASAAGRAPTSTKAAAAPEASDASYRALK